MTKDYSKCIIYKIVNDIDDYVYIVSTTEKLSSRMSKHRFAMKTCNSRIYQHMRKYGPKYFHIVLIRYYSCSNKEELLKEERKEFESYDKNILLNIYRPSITCVEKQQLNTKCCKTWYVNNKTYHTDKMKTWHANNRTHHNDKMKIWYANNKLYKKYTTKNIKNTRK